MSAASLFLLGQCFLGVAAMACLSLSMKRYERRVTAYLKRPVWRRRLRRAGWSLIAIMLLTATARDGWGHGLVSLLAALSLAAVVVVLSLTYRPPWLIYFTIPGLLGAMLMVGSMFCQHWQSDGSPVVLRLEQTARQCNRSQRVRHMNVEDGRGYRLERPLQIVPWPMLIFWKGGEELGRLVRLDKISRGSDGDPKHFQISRMHSCSS